MIENQIRELIIERYGSLLAFTNKICMSYSTFQSMLKRGFKNSNINSVIKICKELRISADELYKDKIVTQDPPKPEAVAMRSFPNPKPVALTQVLKDFYVELIGEDISYSGHILTYEEKLTLINAVKVAVKVTTENFERRPKPIKIKKE